MRFILTLALLISIPFFSWNVALATEKVDPHAKPMSEEHPVMTVDEHAVMDEPMSEEHPVMTVDEHAVMDEPMSEEHTDMTVDEHTNMDEQDKHSDMSEEGHKSDEKHEGDKEHGSDEGHEPLEEIPANMKVLGTFAFINISFILIGIWNKWIRKEKKETEVL